MYDTAFFVCNPRRLEDLWVPHFSENERPFQILRTVTLSAIDYENFITDMLADRAFLEDTPPQDDSGIYHCILIHQRGKTDGVLVVPAGTHVELAAYLDAKTPEIDKESTPNAQDALNSSAEYLKSLSAQEIRQLLIIELYSEEPHVEFIKIATAALAEKDARFAQNIDAEKAYQEFIKTCNTYKSLFDEIQ